MTLGDLESLAGVSTSIGLRYRSTYPASLDRAGIGAVDFIDSFPVLTANFGYTRGGSGPGDSRLVPFKDRRGRYAIYAELGSTEALLFRLRPERVARWLEAQGCHLGVWSDAATARATIIENLTIPAPGDEPTSTPGSMLLTLVHSFAHRLMRLLAVHAGIDRDALSELLVPSHLGFFVYAAARGDFVLGGLQAVFETGLDELLTEFFEADSRCALDPGCARHGAACVACLHLGEPSCRYFNRFLDRRVLDAVDGYLVMGI